MCRLPRVVCHSIHVCVCRWTKGLSQSICGVYNMLLLHHHLLKHHREGSCLQAILFQICYEYKVRRLNNILIIGHLRATDISQCIYNHTHLTYCVNNHIGLWIALRMRCYLHLSACKMAWVRAKLKICRSMTVTP